MNIEKLKGLIKESQVPEGYEIVFTDSTVPGHPAGAAILKSVSGKMENASPIFFLDKFLEIYESEGASAIEGIIRQMHEVSLSAKNDPCLSKRQIMASCSDKNIFMKLINAERNGEILANSPHRVVEDLAIVYCFLIKDNKKGIASIQITNHLTEEFKVTEEDLYEKAFKNTKLLFPFHIIPLGEAIAALNPSHKKEKWEKEPIEMEDHLMVVTNERMVYGAAVMLYPEIMNALSEKLGDFYLLPSSIHEVLIYHGGSFSKYDLKQVVLEVNRTILDEKEFLSNHIYYYDKKRQQIRIAY